MHVLTKLFIVLVSLLAVFLVPLVVVYASNENSFKAKYQAADSSRAAAAASLTNANVRFEREKAQLTAEIEKYRIENNGLLKDGDQKTAENRKLQSELADSRSLQAQINTKLATLVSTADSGQQLIASLIGELRTLRTDALAAERRSTELQERVSDVSAQLEVAVAARRALQEEVQRIKEDHARAMHTIDVVKQKYGDVPGDGAVALGELAPDKSMTADILAVSRSGDQVLADINVGSTDGVKVGWMMTLARGGVFLGRLNIIEVDVKRATGRVLLEDPKVGLVSQGDQAISYAGRR